MSIMDMALLAITIWVPALAGLLIVMPDWLLSLFDTPRRIARRSRPVSDDGWNDQNPPKSLNYNYIDWLERDLKVGKYDPDRIALGFDDTKPEPKPLDPEIDELPMPDAVKADEGCPCGVCRSQRRSRESEELVDRLLADLNEARPKPVDDSWADENIRDGVYGPEPRGLVRRIVDNHGNWTEIRSFGG